MPRQTFSRGKAVLKASDLLWGPAVATRLCSQMQQAACALTAVAAPSRWAPGCTQMATLVLCDGSGMVLGSIPGSFPFGQAPGSLSLPIAYIIKR